jgi:manganese/zinc/iron transport system substrate-binding protein
VKGDDEKFSRADLVFYNGLGLEHGASLSSLLRANPKAMAVGERIAETVPSKILKRGEVVDPHVWMDISLWKEGVSPIAEKLAAIDPEGAGEYRARASRLALRMERAHLELKEKLRTVPSEKRYLMTSHDAFRYFTKTYLAEEGESDWQDRFAAPEGLAPDGQLNPVDIRRMIEFLGRKRISVIFPESNVSRDSIRKIASAGSEMGLQVRVCSEPLYGDSASGHTYLEMMSSNGDVIARHLQ